MTAPLALSNQRVQRLRRLVSRKDYRRAEGVLVVEGATLLSEAALAGWEIEAQFVGPGAEPLLVGGEVLRVAGGVLEKVASTESPQPIIGLVKVPPTREGVLSSADFVVVAHGIADPGNLGTMMRTAEGAGADAFAVTPGTADHTSPKVVRSAAGSLFRLPVVELPDLAALTAAELVTIGTTSHHGRCYTDLDLTRRVALVMGSESHGLDSSLEVSHWATIPLAGPVESLNVAMACAVLSFEVARQRRSASGTVEAP